MAIPRELWYLPRPRRKDKYPGGFPLHFEKKLFEMYKFPNNEILQPFGGKAEYGIRCDVKSDLKYGAKGESYIIGKEQPDIVCDAHNLPFPDNSFSFVLLDPPYSNEESKRLYGTGKLHPNQFIREAVRVCKFGGYIAIYGTRLAARPKGTTYNKIICILTRVNHQARICIIFKKEK